MYYLEQLGFCLLLLLVIGVPMYLWETRTKRRKIQTAFAGREKLDDQTFYERYFQSQGVPKRIVSKIKKILQEELDADLSQMRAEDDFSQNLKFFWDYDSMADVEIVVRLEEEFGIKINNEEAQDTRTVADMVNLVWRKIRQQDV